MHQFFCTSAAFEIQWDSLLWKLWQKNDKSKFVRNYKRLLTFKKKSDYITKDI